LSRWWFDHGCGSLIAASDRRFTPTFSSTGHSNFPAPATRG
jgi:hypothetical protein